MVQLHWTWDIINSMTYGDVMSVYNHMKAEDYNKYVLEEERARRLALYASSWLDNKGKTPQDMWVCPWDGQPEKVTVPDEDEALARILEAQRRIKAKQDGLKKGRAGIAGNGLQGVRPEDGRSEQKAEENDQRPQEGGPEIIDNK